MLNKPSVSGAMILALIVAFGSGWFQRDAISRIGGGEAHNVEVAEIDSAVEEDVEDVVEEPERTATAPSRVVDSAGFPVVPGEPREEVRTGPIVTINGRPLGSDEPAVADAAADPVEPAVPGTDAEQTVAVVEPPRPIPRPEGLTLPQQGQTVDHNAVTASVARPASGISVSSEGFMSREEREALAPMPGQPVRPAGASGELVAIVGNNGQVIWVHADQAGPAGRVAPMPSAPVGNQYGFVYDDYDYRW